MGRMPSQVVAAPLSESPVAVRAVLVVVWESARPATAGTPSS
jgi:hypothetical protein